MHPGFTLFGAIHVAILSAVPALAGTLSFAHRRFPAAGNFIRLGFASILLVDYVVYYGWQIRRPARIERVSVSPAAHAQPMAIDMNQAGDLMQKRCSKCHNLDRGSRCNEGRPGMAEDCQPHARNAQRGHIRY
jgi:hypothetical protein